MSMAGSAPALTPSILAYDAVYHVLQRSGYTQIVSQGIDICFPTLLTWQTAFTTSYRVAEGINLIGFAACLFLMVSWAILPPKQTRRHYLSVGLVIGAMSLAVSEQLAALPRVWQLTKNSSASSSPSLRNPNSALMKSHQMTCIRVLSVPGLAPSL